MSYLTMSGGIPNFTKAVISLWFRIPQASIDAAAESFDAALRPNDSVNPYGYGFGWKGGVLNGNTNFESKPPQMSGIIPLLTFGKAGSQTGAIGSYLKNYGSWTVTGYYWHSFAPESLGGEWLIEYQTVKQTEQYAATSPSKRWDTEPSYIGVWCTKDPPRTLLAVNLETGICASTTGVLQPLIGWDVDDRQFYSGPRPFPPRTWDQKYTYGDDNPSPYISRTANFRTHPLVGDVGQFDGTTDESPPFGITVMPDEWHHLLVSFDLTTPCRIHGVQCATIEEQEEIYNAPNPSAFVDSAPKIWIAFDDVNKKGRDLSYYWRGKGATGAIHDPPDPDKPDAEGANPNEVLSPQGWGAAGLVVGIDHTDTIYDEFSNETYSVTHTGVLQPQYNSGAGTIDAQGEPMGLPASAVWVDSIYRVEMAEFQMFTGLTLDTNVKLNRRAFVDKDGKPVPSTQQQSTDDGGNIVKDKGSIELLGKRPEILLHGSNNWIAGYNTGSIGIKIETISGEEVVTKLPSGQFTPVAGIEAWKPDPSLEETTS